MKLDDVLSKYSTKAIDIRAGGSKAALDLEELRADLEQVRAGSKTGFYIATGMLVTLFVIASGIVLVFVRQPSLMAGILAASGLSTMGIVRTMVLLWKDKVASDMLIGLAMNVNEDNMQAILDVLKKRF